MSCHKLTGEAALVLLVVQIIVITGPICLIVYYTGNLEKTAMGTCTLQSVQINGSTIPMGGAFIIGEEAIGGCFLNLVHVLTHEANESVLEPCTVVTANPINHNSTDPFPCFYSYVQSRGWHRPEDPNDVECYGSSGGVGYNMMWGDSSVNDNCYKRECLNDHSSANSDYWKCSEIDCKGAKLKEQYYKAYFNDARQVFVSLHSEETWSEDRAYAKIGWIGTGLLLLEIVVGLYCFGYKKTKKVTSVFTY